MVIIDTTQFDSFESYLSALSKKARKECERVSVLNRETIYQEIPYDRELVARFMGLWERQLVRGKPIQWAYPIETVDEWARQGNLLLFEARMDETVGLHYLKREGGFWQAEPPMWDKTRYEQRSIGTFLWFSVIKWGIENRLGIINLGGGIDEWREMIRTRDDYPNPKYKWRFIPEGVKHSPDTQPDYRIISEDGRKVLVYGDN